MSVSLWARGLQHTRLPCPSQSPRFCSNSCPLSWQCHLILCLFSFCLQSFPASESFPMSWLLASGGQNIGASASVLPINIQGWFPLELIGLIPCSPTDSRLLTDTLLQHHNSKASVLWCSAFFMVQPSRQYMTTGKILALTKWTFVGRVMPLLFNMLSRFVTIFLPWSKHLLISWLQSSSTIILEPKKIKSVTASIFSSSICHEAMRPDAMILVFWMLSIKPAFSLSSFTLIKRLVSLHFLPLEWYHLHTWGYWSFSQQSWFQLVIHPTQHFAWCTLHIS